MLQLDSNQQPVAFLTFMHFGHGNTVCKQLLLHSARKNVKRWWKTQELETDWPKTLQGSQMEDCRD